MTGRSSRSASVTSDTRAQVGARRSRWLLLAGMAAFGILLARFFYLQVMMGDYYQAKAERQYQNVDVNRGDRGQIYTSDEKVLVSNQRIFEVYYATNQVTDADYFYDQVAPIIAADPEASASLKTKDEFKAKMAAGDHKPLWPMLAKKVSAATKAKLEALHEKESQQKLQGLHFEGQIRRFYPEGDMAAHVLGFYSSSENMGKYGIEGGLDKELAGKTAASLDDLSMWSSGAALSDNLLAQNLDGRDIYLTINRDLQSLAQDALTEGMQRFGAARGEIIITNPHTGEVLALATAPTYEPQHYTDYDTSLYKNPSAADLYEPGSTFKVLTVAAGVDAGVIGPDTKCTSCAGPRSVGGYTINTWDGVHYPNTTMTEALEKSNNVAMIFITDLLGANRFREYLRRFGIGQKLDSEIEDDVRANFQEVWGPVEVATRSFGQGISVSSLQLVRAVGAIANGGKLMQLHFVKRAYDQATETYYDTRPEVLGEVISEQSAKTVAEMMQASAQHGEAQFIYKNTDMIAGKTGTAQIPDYENGGYEEDATIASFIGFAPYDDPQFLMLVKFERPTSSPWAAETAAVLWKELAEKLFVIFGIS